MTRDGKSGVTGDTMRRKQDEGAGMKDLTQSWKLMHNPQEKLMLSNR